MVSGSLSRQKDNIFVIGTDTGVGKTVLSLLLVQFFYAKGYSPFYLKPIQTGCKNPSDVNSDAGFIYRHVRPLRGKDPAESVIYCFKNPKAPYFAARDEGMEIDVRVIRKVVEESSLLYFSGSGSEQELLVPVERKNIDGRYNQDNGRQPQLLLPGPDWERSTIPSLPSRL